MPLMRTCKEAFSGSRAEGRTGTPRNSRALRSLPSPLRVMEIRLQQEPGSAGIGFDGHLQLLSVSLDPEQDGLASFQVWIQ